VSRRRVLAAAAVGTLPAQVAAASDIERLRALNEQYIRAGAESDKAWFERMLLPDFVCVASDGRMLDRAAFLAQSWSPLSTSRLEEVRVRAHGDTGLVHARYAWAVAGGGPSGVTVYTDVYVRQGRDWRVASAQLTRAPP
jgi:ketosteroid isomerase-like protein